MRCAGGLLETTTLNGRDSVADVVAVVAPLRLLGRRKLDSGRTRQE